MSLGVKRVTSDFAWPVDPPWTGYVNPHDTDMVPYPACMGFDR